MLTDSTDNAFKTAINNPRIPTFNPNQPVASHYQNLNTSTPVNLQQTKRQHHSTADYFAKSGTESNINSNTSPSTNSNSKKANTNTSNND